MAKAESKEFKSKRFYPCPNCDKDHPSATTLLGVIASPALNGWLAKNGVAKLNVLDQAIKDTTPGEHYADIRRIAEARWKLTEDTAFWKSGKEVGKEAADIGTMVHSWVEADLHGKTVSMEALPEQGQNAAKAYLQWKSEHQIKVIKTEQTFYGCKLNVAGTADAVVELDGELTLMDWKSSTGIYSTYPIQLWIYALCDESQYADRLYRQVAIGRFGKDGTPEMRIFKRNEFPSIDTARDIVTACGHIFNFNQMWEAKFPYQRKPKPTEVKA